MKKILMIFMLFFGVIFSIASVKADTTEYYTFETFNGKKYDLQTGAITDNELYSITSKMVLNPATTNREITLPVSGFHHLLLFDKHNGLYGYYNSSNSSITEGKYLGDLSGSTFVVPAGVVSFAFMNYNYEVIRDDTAYTYPSIDIEAWEGLTYRDIFEGNNLITGTWVRWGGTYNESEVTPITYDSVNDITTITVDDSHAVSDSTHYFRDYPLGSNLFDNHDYYVAFNLKIDTNKVLTTQPFQVGLYNPNLFYDNPSLLSAYPYDDTDLYADFVHKSHIFSTGSNMTSWFINFNIFDNAFGGADSTFNFSAGEYAYIYIKDYVLYDLTEIILGGGASTLPTASEFEEMRLYYEKYKDVSGNALDYNDIFGNATRYGGSNNLIPYGGFSSQEVSSLPTGWGMSWTPSVSYDHTVVDNTWIYTWEHGSTSVGINTNDYISHDFSYHDIYYHIKVDTDTGDLIRMNLYGSYQGGSSISNYVGAYENLTHNTPYIYSGLYNVDNYLDYVKPHIYLANNEVLELSSWTISEVLLYDFTAIFGENTEPTLSEIDIPALLDIWTDPLGDYYSVYYTAGVLSTMSISYSIRDNIPIEHDIMGRWDELKASAGITEGSYLEVLIGIVILIIVTLILGSKGVSVGVFIFVEAMTFLLCVLLGFFPAWIVIVLLIILVGLGLKNVLIK